MMKNIPRILLAIIFCASSFLTKDAYAAGRKNMREFFDEMYVIKTYLSSVKNSTGDRGLNVNEVEKKFADVLGARRSHTFNITSSEKDADVAIEIYVVEYFWTEKDPVDAVFSPIAAAVDGAIEENYVRMAADITVTDAKSGRELWSERVASTLTDDTMTKEDSYSRGTERLALNFLKELLRRPRR